jgi:polyvinyl alcohol dehydrogenase (cytochrome)
VLDTTVARHQSRRLVEIAFAGTAGLVAFVSTAPGTSREAGAAEAVAIAASWPQFGFDQGGTRFNPRERVLSPSTVSSLREVWRRDIGKAIWSSAAVAGGAVYIGERGGRFCALRAARGSIIWCRRISGAPAAAAVVGARLVARTSSSLLYALDRATGRVLWRSRVGTTQGGFPPAPTISGTQCS